MKEGEPTTAGLCCCEGVNRTLPRPPPEGWIFAISKLSCRFMAGCGDPDGARRIVTTLEVGRNCNAPILNAGVSCMEAISKEKVSWTAVCMAPAGCGPLVAGVRTNGAGAVGIWIGSGMVAVVVGCEMVGRGTKIGCGCGWGLVISAGGSGKTVVW